MNHTMKNKVSYFLALFFMVISFGQLEKIYLFSTLAIYLHEVLIVLWLIFWIIKKPELVREFLADLKKRVRFSSPVMLLCIWILLGWMTALLSNRSLSDSIFYSMRLLFYGVFFSSFILLEKKKLLNTLELKMGMFAAGCYLLYFGVLQYFFLPDTRFLQFLGWDDHYNRLISTILDPGFTGILFILNIFILIQLRLSGLKIKTPAFIFTTLLFTIGIALTYSRASYIAYGVSIALSIAYCMWQKEKELRNILIGTLVIFIVFIPLLPRTAGEGVRLERTSTIIARTTSAQADLGHLQSWQWLTGKGLFSTEKNQLLSAETGHNRVPDNWLVMLLSGTGIIGTGLFLIILIKAAWQGWKKNPIFWLALLAVLIHGFFNASLIYVFVLVWLGVLYLRGEVNR